eukprot:gnl/TRDRNA2_/TRDRNA2_173575_c0_seq7.p1 gnl/TRDRNA2_/TRDRNA2_173575_c0~~gnl/TRDRNA2_/TRDRNA2_173575_c0_seq7.p1  ORF type:complete len:213 (+),score=28.08 gnl/TRDRNA2_/TRDRNA2_173575_c0_seq7:2-640(+)
MPEKSAGKFISCIFDMLDILAGDPKLFDVATANTAFASGVACAPLMPIYEPQEPAGWASILASEPAEQDKMVNGSDTHYQSVREQTFSLDVLRKGLDVQLEKGQASDGLLIAPPPGPRPGSRSSPRRRLHERKPHHSVESQAEPMMCDEVVSEGEGSLCEEKSTYHPPQLLKSSTRARSRGARSEDSTSHPAGSALHTARALRHVEGLYGAK